MGPWAPGANPANLEVVAGRPLCALAQVCVSLPFTLRAKCNKDSGFNRRVVNPRRGEVFADSVTIGNRRPRYSSRATSSRSVFAPCLFLGQVEHSGAGTIIPFALANDGTSAVGALPCAFRRWVNDFSAIWARDAGLFQRRCLGQRARSSGNRWDRVLGLALKWKTRYRASLSSSTISRTNHSRSVRSPQRAAGSESTLRTLLPDHRVSVSEPTDRLPLPRYLNSRKYTDFLPPKPIILDTKPAS